MESSRISQIEKARRYADEARGRVVFDQFHATIKGDNDSHQVAFAQGRWSCNCHYFQLHGDCSHTRALERVLDGMVVEAANEPLPSAA